MKSFRFLAGVVSGALGLVAVLQNSATARLELLWWTLEGPMYLLLLFVLFAGLVAGYLFGRVASRQRRRKREEAGRKA